MVDPKELKYNKLKLSVVFDTDSFFYSLINEQGDLVEEMRFSSVKDGFEAVGLFLKKVDKSAFVFSGLPFAHIPYDDFDAKSIRTYLDHLAYVDSESVYHFDKVFEQAIFTCYAINGELSGYLNALPQKVEINHISSALVRYVSQNQEIQLFSVVEKRRLHAVAMINGQLKIYNQYRANNAEDILYFTLLIYSQMGLDPNKDTLWLSGEITKDSALYNKLYQYIRNVEFVDIASSFKVPGSLPAHRYMDAYVGSLCAL